MVTSIVLTGEYKIGISNGKIKTPDGVTVEIKNIPFIRYRFTSYGDSELEYIKANMGRFECLHIVEVDVNADTIETLEKIRDISDSIGIMLYIDINDTDVINGINPDLLDIANTSLDFDVDYLNLRDKSTILDGSSISRLIKQITDSTDFDKDEIGVCGGPCCFYDGRACLTAIKARNILAKYSNRDDVVVPSANHEGKIDNLDNLANCVNKCGCIRYHIYTHDVEAPAQKQRKQSENKKGVKKDSSENKEKNTEEKKKAKSSGKSKAFRFVGYK